MLVFMTEHEGKPPPRTYFILTIWKQKSVATTPIWRGCLETAAGDRRYFATLPRLNDLLLQSGWDDGLLINSSEVFDE